MHAKNNGLCVAPKIYPSRPWPKGCPYAINVNLARLPIAPGPSKVLRHDGTKPSNPRSGPVPDEVRIR